YDFPRLGTPGAQLFPMRRCQGFKLEEASIDEIQAQMSHGTFTSAELLQCFLDRAYQTQPYLNAILQFNPDAFSIARMLDEERANGKSKTVWRPQLAPGPSLGNVVPRDAYVVHRMRQAGAVLLGKGSLSEWADMRSNNYSEGFTARGGQCRSAFNLTVNPGGSSTGPAVAVGANLVPIALGTETDGSVINPAQRNAIVGIKPTVGLTSRAGVIPESLHQDTVGTFGKTVRDAVYALDAIYGVDPLPFYEGSSSGSRLRPSLEVILALGNPEQIAQLEELLKLIQAAGATIINGTDLPHYKQIVSPDGWNWDYGATRGFSNESEYSYIKVDFYNNLRDYLSEVNNTAIKSLEDLVQYNRDNYGSEGGFPGVHPAFGSGQDGLIASLESKGVMNETYFSALEFCRRTTREEGIDAALKYHNKTLDGLLVPPDVAQSIQIAAQAGYPVVTVPAGVSNGSGMPYGLAIMNTAFSEPVLIKYASAIEDLQKSTVGIPRVIRRRGSPLSHASPAIAATQKASPMSSSRLTRAPRHWGAGRPFIPRRSFTISVRRFSEPSASAVATSFLSRFQSLGPQIRTQVLDANQLQLLTLTLNRPSLFPDSPTLTNAAPPALNTPVPPGYHLVYFTPAFLEDELGLDGTDASYNPQFPFTRRMWAGGEVTWPRDADGQPNPLRVGQEVRETTRVLSAEAKVVKKTGEDMIVVGVEKEFANGHGVSIVDKRNWVFRKALPTPSPSSPPASPPRATSSHVATQTTFAISTQGHTHSRSLVQSPVTLFRFSALTFNPHKIHYSLPWAREVEGHRDIVVHGPLNLISILDLWRDTQGKACEDPATAVPKRISYRATSPLYAGDRYSIHLTEKEAGASKVQIVGPEDAIAMKAEIE
ncbi:hypothetical protein N7470_009759, partial [Penicillium chermesinum]